MIRVSPAFRHTPIQIRGQRTVEHILRSAEALFAEVGFEQATTNAIAQRAGISIGSLYQFFSNKDAILEAMAERYQEQTRVALDKALAVADDVDLAVLLAGLLGMLIKLQEQRPYFLQCLGHSKPSPVVAKVAQRLNEAVAHQVALLLERRTRERNVAILALRSRICVEAMCALLPLALRVQGRARAIAITEITAMLVRYVGPTLKGQE